MTKLTVPRVLRLITNPVRQPAVKERLVGWTPAIIYMTKHGESATAPQTGRRSEPDAITVEMVGAGLDLFRQFDPEAEDEAALVYAIIAKADEMRARH